MTNVSNYIFATAQTISSTATVGTTFNITNDFETDAVVELPEATSFVLKDATQIERFEITATGGVATIVKRGLENGDTPVENVAFQKPWGDGAVGYTTQLAFNVIDSEDDNIFEGTQTFNDIDFTGVTTGGLKVKELTTVERDAITNVSDGMIIYNTTDSEFQIRQGATWATMSSGSTQPNASETVAGKVEMATNTELLNEDSTGGTGARLVFSPSQLPTIRANDTEIQEGTDDIKFTTSKGIKDRYGVSYIIGDGSFIINDSVIASVPVTNIDNAGGYTEYYSFTTANDFGTNIVSELEVNNVGGFSMIVNVRMLVNAIEVDEKLNLAQVNQGGDVERMTYTNSLDLLDTDIVTFEMSFSGSNGQNRTFDFPSLTSQTSPVLGGFIV